MYARYSSGVPAASVACRILQPWPSSRRRCCASVMNGWLAVNPLGAGRIVDGRRMIAEVQRQFQAVLRHSREGDEVEKRDPLVVLVTDAVPIGDPFIGPPARDRREGRAGGVVRVRPCFHAHRRPDVHPGKAAVRKPRLRRSNRFAGREIQVVAGDPQLAGAHPELEEAGIDIHERGPLEAREQIGIDRMIEIQQQIGVAENRPRCRLRHPGVLQRAGAGLLKAEDDLLAQAVSLQAPDKAVQMSGITLAIARGMEPFEPVDIAADAEQRLRVLHVHPEMTTQVRGVHDVVRRNHDRGQVPSFTRKWFPRGSPRRRS